jgi:hypothetical protein
MEYLDSLSDSQQITPEPDESSPFSHYRLILTLSSNLRHVPSVTLPAWFTH